MEVGRAPFPPPQLRPLVLAEAQRERGTTEGTGRCGRGAAQPDGRSSRHSVHGPVKTHRDPFAAAEAEQRGSKALLGNPASKRAEPRASPGDGPKSALWKRRNICLS